MRRLAALAVLAALAGAAALLPGSGAGAASTYRVDAIFDNARGIIPGQLVKIAGARVGTVQKVSLTRDYKARIELEVPARFAPFHPDATCVIKPEGLIAENFVQCDPGAGPGDLAGAGPGANPTVPVTQDTEPVSITDLFNIWETPVADRLRVLLSELGAGLAGRGGDLRAVLDRVNPSLRLARRAIALVNRQRTQLQQILTATDPVVAELARRRGDVQRFIDNAATVSQTTAAHRGALASSVHRLPALLHAARPALSELDVVAAAGAPVLADLRAAAPGVNRLTRAVTPFTHAAVPTLRRLAPALGRARTTLREAAPVVVGLRQVGALLDPVSRMLDTLVVSLRDTGGVESLLTYAYDAAAATARYDAIGHELPTHLLFGSCATFATTPQPGCVANYPASSAARATRGRTAGLLGYLLR